MNDKEIVRNIKSWDWSLFFNTVDKLGSQFNQASWRMMKGEVICTALEICSNEKAKYVDEVGYDLVVGEIKIEVKTEKKIIKNNFATKSIQLKNTRGEIQQFEKSFDYLLIANTSPRYISALTDWDRVFDHHVLTGDQIQCRLEKDDLILLTEKEGISIEQTDISKKESLKNYMKDGIKGWIREINNKG
jgi:hypothetical protein